MIGQWKSEVTVNGEDQGTATHQRMWVPGRHGLRMSWQGESDGAVVHAFGISGWDSQKKAIVENWHDALGNHTSVIYPLEKMTKSAWEGTARRVYPDGSVSEGSCKLEKGDEQWIFTVDGEKEGKPEKVRNVTRKVK